MFPSSIFLLYIQAFAASKISPFILYKQNWNKNKKELLQLSVYFNECLKDHWNKWYSTDARKVDSEASVKFEHCVVVCYRYQPGILYSFILSSEHASSAVCVRLSLLLFLVGNI